MDDKEREKKVIHQSTKMRLRHAIVLVLLIRDFIAVLLNVTQSNQQHARAKANTRYEILSFLFRIHDTIKAREGNVSGCGIL